MDFMQYISFLKNDILVVPTWRKNGIRRGGGLYTVRELKDNPVYQNCRFVCAGYDPERALVEVLIEFD